MAADTESNVNVAHMIDLAIGTPEVGVVDFNMLQAVLHILAQQLGVLGKAVTLRGPLAGPQLVPSLMESGHTIAVQEYDPAPDQPRSAVKASESLLVVDRVKKDPAQVAAATQAAAEKAKAISNKSVSTGPQPPGTDAQSGPGEIGPGAVVPGGAGPGGVGPGGVGPGGVGPGGVGPGGPSAPVTGEKVTGLEQQVKDLMQTVYYGAPDGTPPLVPRVQAVEDGVNALNAAVETLINATPDFKKNQSASVVLKPVGGSRTGPGPVGTASYGTVGGPTVGGPGATTGGPGATTGGPGVTTGGPGSQPLDIPLKQIASSLRPGEAPTYDTIVDIYNNMNELQSLIKAANDNNNATREADLAQIWDRIQKVEKILQHCCASSNTSLDDDKILEHINSAVQDKVSIAAKMQESDFRESMEMEFSKIMSSVEGDKSKKEDVLNNIIKQIELLKVIKMDREDLSELLAEKADIQALARKVSHDKFELACEDLAAGLEQTIEKLTFQETLWQQALDDVQREMAMKLDKVDLEPVKEYFYNKLKALQENIKALSNMRKDVEAAGAKKRLLRDVNCITCDANVVMNVEAPRICPIDPLPPHISMKPYITYELDQMRKKQKQEKCGDQRNLHDWEAIEKAGKKPHSAKITKMDRSQHPCYRYCGGMHTVTTPAQRVARAGHFMRQWGLEVHPIPSEFATGDDGKMYKMSVEKQAEEVKPVKLVEQPKHKPPPIKIGPIINFSNSMENADYSKKIQRYIEESCKCHI